MSRVPIRLRVTLVFALVMAVVLFAVGFFLYLRLGDQLDESIDNSLLTRGNEITALVQASDSAVGGSGDVGLIEAEESFAQVLAANGQVVDSTAQLAGEPVLDPAEVTRALEDPEFVEHESLPGVEGRARLLATPVESGGETLVAVVGASLDDRREALSGLATLLLIGGPIALLAASLAAYWATGGALRPVDEMRRRAATISAGGPDERLPVPPAGDELTRLGETLNDMLARLDTAIERERRFTDDAAHELRTPLALHRTELELALRDTEADTDELRRAMASSIDEVDRLVQLAEDLLVVARSDGGKLALAPERLRAGALLDGVAERFAARAAHAGRELVVEASPLELEGDRLRLEQALDNLVDNALRHGDGQVRLWAEEGEGSVTLAVGDSGPGFPEGFEARAFERFSRADEARGRGGSGLGLAIVETIAHAHGGSAAATNGATGGAEVRIDLPKSQ